MSHLRCDWCREPCTWRPHAWVKLVPVCADCLYDSPDWGGLLVVSIFASRPSWHRIQVS